VSHLVTSDEGTLQNSTAPSSVPAHTNSTAPSSVPAQQHPASMEQEANKTKRSHRVVEASNTEARRVRRPGRVPRRPGGARRRRRRRTAATWAVPALCF
jgi:hypothetical protein